MPTVLDEISKLREEVAELTKLVKELVRHPPGTPCPQCKDGGAIYESEKDRFRSCPEPTCQAGEKLRRDFPNYDKED